MSPITLLSLATTVSPSVAQSLLYNSQCNKNTILSRKRATILVCCSSSPCVWLWVVRRKSSCRVRQKWKYCSWEKQPRKCHQTHAHPQYNSQYKYHNARQTTKRCETPAAVLKEKTSPIPFRRKWISDNPVIFCFFIPLCVRGRPPLEGQEKATVIDCWIVL